MDIKTKIPVHIGLFGHIDSGKTALAAGLSDIISTAGIDAHPQSKERGITIDLGFTSFISGEYLVTLVDGPGHADLIKISASSVEIIDCAMIVIDINKGPQIQTGEHLIIIESLGIKKIIVVLNKMDLFNGDIDKEIKKIRDFFATTPFGPNIPIFTTSAKNKGGLNKLKEGIFEIIKNLGIKRDLKGDLIIPIDHHFQIKGMGAIITGTIIRGTLRNAQAIEILPLNLSARVKKIEIFHQNVESAKAGDRVGVNLKNIDINKVYRGCIATDNKQAFNYCELLEIIVQNNKLFKPETKFGTQIHVTIGMNTIAGNVYPFIEINGKKVQSKASNKDDGFKAFLWLNKKVLVHEKNDLILLSRLDLPPTTLRIMGSARISHIFDPSDPPMIYRYKTKKGYIKNPNHAQGIICQGLAQSTTGAKKIVGRMLVEPFTKILGTFGTKGAIIIGAEKGANIKENDPVLLKELRSFRLKKI